MSENPAPVGEDTPRLDIAELRRTAATRESRHIVPLELRATDDGEAKGITIRGHAAVFDRRSEDLGGYREVIKRGAFRKALDDSQDVRLLINHDAYPVLARTKSKTLELREDPRGLHVFADVAPTQAAQDLRVSMQRGDIDQMSFGFTVAEDSWAEAGGEVTRTIHAIDRLFDVSVVTFPAYPQTDADARQVRNSDIPDESRDAGPDGDVQPDPPVDPTVGSEADGADAPTEDAATEDEPPKVRSELARHRKLIQEALLGGFTNSKGDAQR